MAPDPGKIRETLIMAGQLEREWQRKVPETDRKRTPWMPFPIPAFLALLFEAMPEAPGNRFLEIGCGIATKARLARDFCGLDVTGIEVEPAYAQQAIGGLNVPVIIIDAAVYDSYGDYDLIWFNRVFRDPDAEAALEKIVWDQMAPGAVVMCANLNAPPPAGSFFPVLDDQEVRRGIYFKLLAR